MGDAGERRALLAKWQAFATGLGGGYGFGLDDWLNDVDLRQMIHDGGGGDPAEMRALAAADEAFLAATRAVTMCLWGVGVAEQEGWSAAGNWWYYRVPVLAGPDLAAEVAARLG